MRGRTSGFGLELRGGEEVRGSSRAAVSVVGAELWVVLGLRLVL